MKLEQIGDKQLREIYEDSVSRYGTALTASQAQLEADQDVLDTYLETIFKPDWSIPNLQEMKQGIVESIFEELERKILSMKSKWLLCLK